MPNESPKDFLYGKEYSRSGVSIADGNRDAFNADRTCRSTPLPSPVEAAQWTKIARFLEAIRRRLPHIPLRTIEVGSGRGWLTNLIAAYYGSCEGLEPSLELVQKARELFPSRRMTRGTPATLVNDEHFQPYDIVVSCQDLASMWTADAAAFIRSLRTLLKPGGYLVLTTRHAGSADQWKTSTPVAQRSQEWPTEQQLRGLLEDEGLQCLGVEDVYIEQPSLRPIPAPTPHDLQTRNLFPLYQVWACHWNGEEKERVQPINRSPLVSVIVPTYNRPHRLREALQSILRQSLQDFEIIVVNDGQADVTSIIEELTHHGRITTVKHDRNRGLAAARNTGLRLAHGTYIAYLDDDDRYYPDHLSVLVSALQQSHFKVGYSDALRALEIGTGTQRDVIQKDQPYSEDFDAERLFVSNYVPVLCMMHERACLEKVGLFDETLYAHEDWDLWVRLALHYPFLHIKQTTAEFSWRTDGSSMTSSTKETFLRTTEIIYRKYRPFTEGLPGIADAQEAQLNHRRRALATAAADTCSAERMYQRGERFRTLHIFKEFLSSRDPRTLFMGICSLSGFSYWRFCRLARGIVSWKSTLRRHLTQQR